MGLVFLHKNGFVFKTKKLLPVAEEWIKLISHLISFKLLDITGNKDDKGWMKGRRNGLISD